MKTSKTYPFSVTKHQHDIELRYNRVRNEIHDMEQGTLEWDEDVYDRMTGLSDRLQTLMSYVYGSGGIAWIPSHLYGLAQDTIEWAASVRGAK